MNGRNTFFLTGCASGIGRHVAERLLKEGHRLYATDINYGSLADWASNYDLLKDRLRIGKLDVRDPEAWAVSMSDAVEGYGRIDVLMNIAGYMLAEWVQEATPRSVDSHLDINVKGVIYGTRTAARHMMDRGGGHIINIASIASLAPIPGIAVYSASKYAVRAFSLAAAQELRQHGVYITVISPDAVKTPLLEPQKDLEAAAIVFASPRLFTVEDIADVIFNKVIPYRPLELILPSHRGWLAHLTNMFPRLAFALGPIYRKRGAAHQQQYLID